MEKHLFLGSNTPDGFYGRFNDMLSLSKTIILKGGAGSGKSTLIKKVGARALADGLDVEFYHCSGDVQSLDGVYVPKLKWCVLDGTSPHALEPNFAQLDHFVFNLLQNANTALIEKHRDEIIFLLKNKKQHFTSAYLYLKAMYCIDSARYTESNYSNKTQIYNSICDDIFSMIDVTQAVPMRTLFVSAITPEGLIDFNKSAFTETKNIVLRCEDKRDSVPLLKLLETKLAARNQQYIKYLNPFNPKETEALQFGGLTVLVNIDNVPIFKTFEIDILPSNPDECSHSQLNNYFDAAVTELSLARKAHIETESYYIPAMDFDDINNITQKIMDLIFNCKKL